MDLNYDNNLNVTKLSFVPHYVLSVPKDQNWDKRTHFSFCAIHGIVWKAIKHYNEMYVLNYPSSQR